MVKLKKDVSAEEKILAAAKKVFTTKGMDGARMQDIADEAGINKALLHYYFRSKDQLFKVIFLQEAQKFFPKIKMIIESDLPLFDKISQFADEYISEMQENPSLPWFVLNEINRNPDKFLFEIWGKANMPRPEKFLKQIEIEVSKGNIKPVHPVHLLINMLSLCIFPFVAKPMIQRNLGFSESQFRTLVEQRKKVVPQFIMDSIRK